MKVLIIESSGPQDFFREELDGPLTYHLTKLLGANARLKYTLNQRHLIKGIEFAAKGKYEVLHVSCHGREEGITLADGKRVDWHEFAAIFAAQSYSPKALVMSSCWGATDGIADEFEKVDHRPDIIFGSIDPRYYNEYAVAWTILYNAFQVDGVHRDVAREALKAICAVAHKNFRYLRYHDVKQAYVQYPGEGRRYEIVERVRKKVQ